MSNWTATDLAAYTKRRLKDEERAWRKMVAARNGYNLVVVTAFFREHGIAHIKDCEIGDNWKECPACVAIKLCNNTSKSKRL